MKVNKRIGIYGGAFNPPTLGHVHVLNSVLDKNLVDEIWVLPSYVHFHGKQMVQYEVRLEMCNRAFSDINGIKIKKIEAAIAELVPDYDGSTLSMLEAIRKYQDEDYYLIIGQDNADSMLTWKNGDNLIDAEKFIIVPRPSDNDFTDVMGKPMWYKYDPHIYLTDVPETNLSSTMARELCKRENTPFRGITMPCPPDLGAIGEVVCENVLELIVKYNLYKEGK